MSAEEESLQKERQINPLLIVIPAGVLVLAALFIFVLLPVLFPTADEPITETVGPITTQTTDPAPEPTTTASPAPPQSQRVIAGKDPFQPLVGATGEPPPSPGPGAGGGPAPSAGERVRLLDVFDDEGVPQAQVQVGSTIYTVGEGQEFAGTYKVLSIEGTCATFLHGDDRFTLCEGEEILK